MKSTYIFLMFVAIVSISTTKSEENVNPVKIKNCKTVSVEENNTLTTTESSEDETEKPCPQTDYNAYIECTRKREEKAYERKINQQKTTKERKKRQVICEDSNACSECSGTSCSNCGNPNCDNSCSNCRGSSCSNCNSCSTCTTAQCCHQYCNYNCRSSTCRSSCKKDCGSRITSVPIVRDDASESSSKSNTSSVGSQNITMIFNLHNIINNTNEIDIPIHMNSSNVNDINIQEYPAEGTNGTSGNTVVVKIDDSDTSTQQQTCCHIVLPLTCQYIPTFPFVRCYHRRMRVCGPQCVSQPQPPPRVIALPPEVIWNRQQVFNLPPNVYHYPPAVIPRAPETYRVPGSVVHLPPRLVPLPPRIYTLPSSVAYMPQIQRLPPSYYPLPPSTNYYYFDQIQVVPQPSPIVPAPIVPAPVVPAPVIVAPTTATVGSCYPLCPPYGGYAGYGGYGGYGGGYGGYGGGYGGYGGYYGGYGDRRYIIAPYGGQNPYNWWNATHQNRSVIQYPNTGVNYPVYVYSNYTDPNAILPAAN